MRDSVLLEICVDSVESALAAQSGGAQQIELCSDLLEGGVTPSAGLIETVRERTTIGLHVIVRPRGGDFCYSEDEFETMKRDIRAAKQLGADGLVFGVLTKSGKIDVERTACLVELAQPLSTTFHRAFDMTQNLDRALEDLVNGGIGRVLTSGGEQRVEHGLPAIAKLVGNAKQRVAIMVGGGIRETNVARIVAETGVREIHANLGSSVASPMQYRNEKISLGAIRGHEYQRLVVTADKVRRLLEAASAAHARLAKCETK